ncbi:MAG: hypothetical protein HGB17_00625 [Syntrophobacteraceae bacterium]|nr:hypothetical protein [Syntrophobacteraceae bacterium]
MADGKPARKFASPFAGVPEESRQLDTLSKLPSVFTEDDKVRAEPFVEVEIDLAKLW